MREAVQAVEDELELNAGFLDHLLYADDWSFIVKLHLLVDACVALILTKALASGDLEGLVSCLYLNDQRRGKLAFVKALKLLSPAHIAFVRQMTDVRNKFVHDISYADMTLASYIEGMTSEHRETFLKSVAAVLDENVVLAEFGLEAVDFARQHPRLAIYIGTMDFMMQVYLRNQDLKCRDTKRSAADQIFNRILVTIRADPTNLA